MSPEPLIVNWRGRQVRVRHDDPTLTLHSQRGALVRAAMQIAAMSMACGLRWRPRSATAIE